MNSDGTILAQGAPEAVKPLHVLVVEDIAASRKVLEASLIKLGHTVDIAENGLEAVQKVQSRSYDLVLMDVSMPVMDGVQATTVIRGLTDPAKSRLPIVAVTAFPWPKQRHECLSAGMNAFLPKPLDTDALMSMVSTFSGTTAAGKVVG